MTDTTQGPSPADDRRWMRVAIAEARRAEGRTAPNPPVGCAIVSDDGRLVGTGHTAVGGRPHAEVEALAMAGEAAHGATAYVTLEPCIMCLGAIVQSRVKRVVFGAYDKKSGVLGSVEDLSKSNSLNHQFEISGGLLEEECAALLKNFFKSRR